MGTVDICQVLAKALENFQPNTPGYDMIVTEMRENNCRIPVVPARIEPGPEPSPFGVEIFLEVLREAASDSEHLTESDEATVVSLTLAVLSTLLVRAGEPTHEEEISIELDDITVWLATTLLQRMISLAAPRRSKPLTAAHLEEQLAKLGLKAVYRPGCTCMELGSSSRTCACHLLKKANV